MAGLNYGMVCLKNGAQAVGSIYLMPDGWVIVELEHPRPVRVGQEWRITRRQRFPVAEVRCIHELEGEILAGSYPEAQEAVRQLAEDREPCYGAGKPTNGALAGVGR